MILIYVLLGVGSNSETSCWTPSVDPNTNKVSQLQQNIPNGSFAVASSMDNNQTHSGVSGADSDDGCYISGVSVE